MRLRLVTAAVTALALLAAPAAGAASNRPQIRDPKGDVRGGIAELDIVSARWSTSGRGDAKMLVATLTLAAPPKKEVPYVYDMKSEAGDCGTVWFQYTPGTVMTYGDDTGQPLIGDGDMTAHVWFQCGSSLYGDDISFSLTGNTMTWAVPIAKLPPQIELGARFYDFSALADLGEPVTGHSAPGLVAQSADNAFGDGVWRMN